MRSKRAHDAVLVTLGAVLAFCSYPDASADVLGDALNQAGNIQNQAGDIQKVVPGGAPQGAANVVNRLSQQVQAIKAPAVGQGVNTISKPPQAAPKVDTQTNSFLGGVEPPPTDNQPEQRKAQPKIALDESPARPTELTFFVGPTLSMPSFTSNSPTVNSSSSSVGWGGAAFGLLLGIPYASSLRIQFGLIYAPRSYALNTNFTSSGSQGTFSTTQSMKTVQIPLMNYFEFGRYFSLGVGAYYLRDVGNVSDTNGEGTLGSQAFSATDSSNSFEFIGYTRDEYGLEGSFLFRFPISRRKDPWGRPGPESASNEFFIDLRPVYSLSQGSTASNLSIQHRDLLTFFGWAFKL